MLAEAINAIYPLEPYYINLFTDIARPFTFKKGRVINQAGELDTHMRFIHRGMLKSVHETTTSKGGKREAISWFFGPGDLVINLLSFNKNLPADESLVVLEDCEGIYISKDEFQKLVQQHQPICRLLTMWTSHYLVLYHNRLKMLRTQNAQRRYEQFKQKFPELCAKLTTADIASYLDIDRRTLNRVNW